VTSSWDVELSSLPLISCRWCAPPPLRLQIHCITDAGIATVSAVYLPALEVALLISFKKWTKLTNLPALESWVPLIRTTPTKWLHRWSLVPWPFLFGHRLFGHRWGSVLPPIARALLLALKSWNMEQGFLSKVAALIHWVLRMRVRAMAWELSSWRRKTRPDMTSESALFVLEWTQLGVVVCRRQENYKELLLTSIRYNQRHAHKIEMVQEWMGSFPRCHRW